MKKQVTITDLTRMQGDRVCVAGYLSDLTCIRPVMHAGGLIESWLMAGGSAVIRPFAIVQFDIQRKSSTHPPHTEDQIIDPLYRRQRRMLSIEQRADLLARLDDGAVASIFGAPIHHDEGWYINSGEGRRSLGTVTAACVDDVSFTWHEGDRWDYRLSFRDTSGETYKLSVTDLAFRYCLDHLHRRKAMSPRDAAYCVACALQKRRVYLRIGLARGWAKHPDRCHLQVTGVYSFPDYLQGRCFADLAPEPPGAQAQGPRDPVPF